MSISCNLNIRPINILDPVPIECQFIPPTPGPTPTPPLTTQKSQKSQKGNGKCNTTHIHNHNHLSLYKSSRGPIRRPMQTGFMPPDPRPHNPVPIPAGPAAGPVRLPGLYPPMQRPEPNDPHPPSRGRLHRPAHRLPILGPLRRRSGLLPPRPGPELQRLGLPVRRDLPEPVRHPQLLRQRWGGGLLHGAAVREH